MQITVADIDAEILRRQRNLFSTMFPDDGPLRRALYPKHLEFFAAGAKHRVRLFRAANRVGKTNGGGYELVCHLTGDYPDWWEGKRFNRAVVADVAGETAKLTRDSIQLKLMGKPGEIGTGLIPFEKLGERRAKAGTPDAFDTVRVKHKSGGWSIITFKSFDQGREAFQGTERDVILLDEEPPLAIYTEALTRTMTTGGIVMLTFTPLKGMSETVQFLETKKREGGCFVVNATWDDVPHLSQADKDEMLKSYPPHQRDARSKGVPSLGAGAIYPLDENQFLVDAFPIPAHWFHAYGMDVGWNNTAAVFGAYDRDSDTLYLTSDYKRGQVEPSVHAHAIDVKARGDGKPGAIDPASKGASQKDGEDLLNIYRGLGLKLTKADNGVEAGLLEVWQRLSSGRLKIFKNCLYVLDEIRVYRRDEDGDIVKDNDHCMDAMRYLVMTGISISKQETKKQPVRMRMDHGRMSL